MSTPFTIPDSSQITGFSFIKALSRAVEKKESYCGNMRPLTSEEIDQLQAQGNRADDWTTIKVAADFVTPHIQNSRFFGTCFLGHYSGVTVSGRSSIPLSSGIYDSTLINSCIGNECSIWNTRGINNYFVDDNAVLCNIGTLSCSPTAVFGNGREIVIGIETGGQEVLSFADLTIAFAQGIAHHRNLFAQYTDFIKAYTDHCSIGFGVVESECTLTNCSSLTDSYFGRAAQCDNATLIKNATLRSSSEEPTCIGNGSFVRNSCIQWGSHVDSMAIVDDSVLTEHSHVERHGKVTHSILGPNTGIAEGEVTASLVGPFVGFHHQALLIGALWPEGKGNIAYGANVGSNHTSKAPDQEIYCGEGMFFGLGSNIKFPSDFSQAPYSIIATGVTTLPQRMTFPFSLINSPSLRIDSVSPAYNELLPGWVLSDNLYTIKRNEGKYKKRNKARRSEFSFDVFRPEIIDLMVQARHLLRNAGVIKEYYLESDIPGTGKNFITRQNLLKAITTYSQHIEHYCLDGLFRQCTMLTRKNIPVNENAIVTTPSENPYWEHQCRLCQSEGFFDRNLQDNFERLTVLVSLSAQQVQSAKEKDDIRGRKIIPDYDTVHTSAAEDSFVKETIAACESMKDAINNVMKTITTASDNF